MIISIISIAVLAGIIVVLIHENRRLTNLLLSKNPSAVIAAESHKKPSKKPDKEPSTRIAWNNPVEAVGP
jgi:hypothetical protein